nr:MAG TPA: beta-sandwich protein [Bacteriophage sp.]
MGPMGPLIYIYIRTPDSAIDCNGVHFFLPDWAIIILVGDKYVLC